LVEIAMTPQLSPHVISVGYEQADALNYDCDVLVLKYAQGFHGVDDAVAKALQTAGCNLAELQPEVGRHVLVESRGAIKARSVLLLGTPPLLAFGYATIEEFAHHSLEILVTNAPQAVHIAMTLHGPNFGLDVQECVHRQVAGIRSALGASLFPRALRAVTIVERDADRLEALAESLRSPTAHTFLEVGVSPPSAQSGGMPVAAPLRENVEVRTTVAYSAQPDADQRPSVFVAMPFNKTTRTVWKYGIEKPVHEAGLNCERMDEMHFVGDIVERMKSLIQRAELVVADISDENPNVFLELGYAWGVGRPTLLLAQRDDAAPQKELPFDVRTQACVFYLDAVELEEKLKAALEDLKLIRS
jgi:hypothetical protein